ncbi:hypothetical protein NDA14_007113 [Ustilago hordei]|nr:hypothetical protein NDA10_004684 [Ustilago hordei]KAJ1579809.1 hypothetical protein NDA12_007671 [Ustilago hordei]KAJ1598689.1 hypothetical protein NDA14_007113 [Ustilago hordei]
MNLTSGQARPDPCLSLMNSTISEARSIDRGVSTAGFMNAPTDLDEVQAEVGVSSATSTILPAHHGSEPTAQASTATLQPL